MKALYCPKCGAPNLKEQGQNYKCLNCGSLLADDYVQTEKERIKSLFSEALAGQKEEQIANLRKNLWNAAREENISSVKVLQYAREIKKLLPEDFMSGFYEVACGENVKALNKFLNNVNDKLGGIYAADIAQFLVRGMEYSTVLPLKNLISRYLKDGEYKKYMTAVEDEAQKIKNGVYSPQVPRDVFLAYSGKDYEAVNEIVEFLEENGISCFVALRNLRHGKGSVENYGNELKTAMHNCKCVVFLSSNNSRSLECDALKIELPYIRDYEPKMGRIEYLLEEYKETSKAANQICENFFKNLEYCRTRDDLIARILKYITGFGEEEEPKPGVKYCLNCGAENPQKSKFCMECGSKEFIGSYKDYLQLKSQKDQAELRQKLEAEYAQKLKKQQQEYEQKLKAQQELRLKAEQEAETAGMTKEVRGYYLKAINGDAEAQNNLGRCYANGQGVEQNYKQAVYWYTKSAEQGNADAQNNLGWCYDSGKGVEQDYKQAVYWYTKSAEQGNAVVQKGLGDCYKYGLGVEQDYKQAVYWYTKSAEQGNAVAQKGLGDCYKYGLGVEQDYKQVVYWYTKSAEQGNAKAQFNLGVCYEKGQGVNQDYNKAVYWYTKAAEQGDAVAQYNLGNRYYYGYRVKKDYKQAIYWYTKAAEQGDAYAQHDLGYCYDRGNGVKKDYKQAVYWYTKAAEQGDALAQKNLGVCYEYGNGVEQDYKQAVYWYTKSAEQGNADAQRGLGNCYYYGQGIVQDKAKAKYWITKAAEQGDSLANIFLKEWF